MVIKKRGVITSFFILIFIAEHIYRIGFKAYFFKLCITLFVKSKALLVKTNSASVFNRYIYVVVHFGQKLKIKFSVLRFSAHIKQSHVGAVKDVLFNQEVFLRIWCRPRFNAGRLCRLITESVTRLAYKVISKICVYIFLVATGALR